MERENEQLRAELEVYKNRNTGGRKKHDEAWMTSYRDFAVKYEGGMTIMEIVAQGEISRRTSYTLVVTEFTKPLTFMRNPVRLFYPIKIKKEVHKTESLFCGY